MVMEEKFQIDFWNHVKIFVNEKKSLNIKEFVWDNPSKHKCMISLQPFLEEVSLIL